MIGGKGGGGKGEGGRVEPAFALQLRLGTQKIAKDAKD
jgi:hypothetical protein